MEVDSGAERAASSTSTSRRIRSYESSAKALAPSSTGPSGQPIRQSSRIMGSQAASWSSPGSAELPNVGYQPLHFIPRLPLLPPTPTSIDPSMISLVPVINPAVSAQAASSISPVGQMALRFHRRLQHATIDPSMVPAMISDCLPVVSKAEQAPPVEACPAKRAQILGMHQDWVLADGFLRPPCGDDLKSAFVTQGSTSKGEIIVVGLRAVPPPGISRLFFRLLPNQNKPTSSRDNTGVLHANAVAAHRNAILLRFVIRIDTDTISDDNSEELLLNIREEFFVYQASPLSLISLPTCGHPLINSNASNNIGILCSNHGDFVVAHLRVTPSSCYSSEKECPVIANLCYMLGKDGLWRSIKDVPIRYAEGQERELSWWVTDAVVPFGQYICWVDYLRGMLFCDVFSPYPELKYVPLPVDPYMGCKNILFGGRGPLYALRSVCATGDSKALKFVDVASSRCWFYGRPQHISNVISSWILTSDSFVWMEDGRLGEAEYVSLTKQHNLPCSQLEFPHVDSKDPKMIYFALREDSCLYGEARLVTFNMSSKKIAQVTPYTFGSFEHCKGDVDKFTTSCNLFYMKPFLPCEFSKYVDLDMPYTRGREAKGGHMDVEDKGDHMNQQAGEDLVGEGADGGPAILGEVQCMD